MSSEKIQVGRVAAAGNWLAALEAGELYVSGGNTVGDNGPAMSYRDPKSGRSRPVYLPDGQRARRHRDTGWLNLETGILRPHR